MEKIESLEKVYLILAFIVPGFIALFVRAQFVTGRMLTTTTTTLHYLVVTVTYYALIFPIAEVVISIKTPGAIQFFSWFALIFVGPVILGLLLGLIIQRDWLHRFLRWCGLNPVHVMPTAWDWKFSRMPEEWVLVTLKDGTRFCGFCGEASFASSDPSERDIFIQWIYDIDENENWTPRGETGVLICPGEVQTIEFWPYAAKDGSNDQRS